MKERSFGVIPEIEEGKTFKNRLELSKSKVHRPIQAGISGSQNQGADSIVLSGGYEDDEDHGDLIIYTGHGGRDLATGKQSSDQELIRQNLALVKNCQQGLPVRVIRGSNHNSIFSPKIGYRYDGLYRVEDYWHEIGQSGYKIWRYRLSKITNESNGLNIPGDAPISANENDENDYGRSKRAEVLIQRIIRDTRLSKRIKELYNNRCQVCGVSIRTNSGLYSEAAHIKPLGAPHNGPDIIENILCLCPNHHASFDFGGFSINDNFDLIGETGALIVNPNHKIEKEFLKYHRDHFFREY
ncbi:HNH endonuclease [bacterium SCSIO 12741]|nr:HNH endonuclease [bacterium SCSIO 12741]